MMYNKILFLIAIIVIVLATVFLLTINQKTEPQNEVNKINPQKICVDLLDMGFSSEQECLDFVNEMINKMGEYSDLDCQKHALLFKKLETDCP